MIACLQFRDQSCKKLPFESERNGDWIRVASTADLWGVEYSAEAKMSVAAVPHSHPALQSQPSDDSSVWVPIVAWAASQTEHSSFLSDSVMSTKCGANPPLMS